MAKGTKSAKRASKKTSGDKKKSNRKPKRSFKVYIHRALKGINKNLTVSSRSMKIFNSFVNDMFERIAVQASALARANKRRTLGSREIQTAVRLVLPAELAKHAMVEGTKAVAKTSA